MSNSPNRFDSHGDDQGSMIPSHDDLVAESDDPLFDSLLSECLAGPAPPDLLGRILIAFEHQGPELRQSEAGQSAGSVLPPPIQVTAPHGSSPNITDYSVVKPLADKRPGNAFVRRSPLAMLVGIASLAASVVLAFWLFPDTQENQLGQPLAVDRTEPASTDAQSKSSAKQPDAKEPPVQGSGVGHSPTASVDSESPKRLPSPPITLGGAEFAGSPEAEIHAAVAGNSSPMFPSPKVALDDKQIVQLINQRLEESWAASGIQPAAEVDYEAYVSRLDQLTGTDLASLVIDMKMGPTSSASVGEIPVATWTQAIKKGLQVKEVQERLASRLAGSLLGRTGVRRVNREQFISFVRFLEPAIGGKKRYDALVLEMLSARGSVEPKSKTFDPATVWMGSLVGPQSVALAEQAGHALLDVDLKCGRCHDHPLDGRVWQDQYWQFSAMFETGLQWKVDDDGVLQVSASSPGEKQNVIFYEKLDGRQRAAKPKVPADWVIGAEMSETLQWPTADAGSAELSRLANWMPNNPRLARATVNLVWEAVYGRPLVGSVANPTAAAETDALNRLQEELAEQLRSHDFDVGRLFTWVIAAKPMRLGIPENWQSPKFESATATELRIAAEQVRGFASFPDAVPKRRFNDLLARVNVRDSGLIQSLDAANNFPGGLLGQIQAKTPGPEQSKQVAQTKSPSLDQLLSASLESIDVTNDHEEAEDDQQLPAEWLSQVGGPDRFQRRAEHLYYLAGYWHPSPQQLEVARALREQSATDAVALRKLWWVLANESL